MTSGSERSAQMTDHCRKSDVVRRVRNGSVEPFPTMTVEVCLPLEETLEMAKIERNPQRLVVQSGSTTLTLDKSAARASLQRRLLFWARKPIERRLEDVSQVNIDANVDRASGVELCSTMIVMRDGSAWALPLAVRKDATESADAIRDFLGIPQPS